MCQAIGKNCPAVLPHLGSRMPDRLATQQTLMQEFYMTEIHDAVGNALIVDRRVHVAFVDRKLTRVQSSKLRDQSRITGAVPPTNGLPVAVECIFSAVSTG